MLQRIPIVVAQVKAGNTSGFFVSSKKNYVYTWEYIYIYIYIDR